MTDGTHPSTASRLVARAARRAVRAADAFSGLHEVEISDPPLPPASASRVAPSGSDTARPPAAATPPPAPARARDAAAVAAARPPRHTEPRGLPPAVRAAPPHAPAAVAEVPRPRHDAPAAAEPQAAAPRTAELRSDATEPPPTGAPIGLPEGAPGRPEPVGWLGLAEAEPGDAASPPAAPPTWPRDVPQPVSAPARDVQPAVSAAAPPRPATAPPSVVARPPAAAPSTGSSPPSGQSVAPLRAAAPAGPPQVQIDRIEVITPPARGPAPDPMASLVNRRTAASRHARGGR